LISHFLSYTNKEEFCTVLQQEQIKEDDVVIKVVESVPRGEWRKMRVSQVFPSEDSLVKKVDVTN